MGVKGSKRGRRAEGGLLPCVLWGTFVLFGIPCVIYFGRERRREVGFGGPGEGREWSKQGLNLMGFRASVLSNMKS